MTFSVEDHGIVQSPPPSAQEFICPQEFLINFDHLAAIRSALVLAWQNTLYLNDNDLTERPVARTVSQPDRGLDLP
jgi:hypothetical protein